jgi:hypothetical protein
MTKVQLIELLVKVNRRQKGLTSKFTSVRTAFKFEHGLLADLLATAAEAPEAARILELLEQSQATPDGTEPSTTTVAAEFGGIKATLVARLTREDQLGAQLETAENKRKATVLKMRELVQKVRQVQTVAMADRQKVTVAEERVALLTEGHAAALEASAASTAQLEATVQSLRERSAVDEEGSAAEAVALRAELVSSGEPAPDASGVGSARWLGPTPRPSVLFVGARDAGHEPLAELLLAQPGVCGGPLRLFDDESRYMMGLPAALSGAHVRSEGETRRAVPVPFICRLTHGHKCPRTREQNTLNKEIKCF